MNLSLRKYLLSLNIALLCLFSSAMRAQSYGTVQSVLPSEGESVKFSSLIQFPKAYVSGICMLKATVENITGSIFNEFGVSFITFVYNKEKEKIKLVSLSKPLDKWYIRLVLKQDLVAVMKVLERGGCEYQNNLRGITYKFEPIEEDTSEEDGCSI